MALSLRKKRRYSKKSKRNLRKFTDVRDVEEFLEEQRREESTGGIIADKTDGQLFVLETEKDEGGVALKRKRSRDLVRHSEGNLLPNSTWKSKPTRRNETRLKKMKMDCDSQQCSDGQEKDCFLAHSSSDEEYDFSTSHADLRRKKGEELKQRPVKLKRSVKPVVQDLWGDHSSALLENTDLPDEHYLRVTRKKPVKRPITMQVKPSALKPVELPPPGASYNPTFDDHQKLLQAAVAVEEGKLKEVEKVEKRLKMTPMDHHQREQVWLDEMLEGLEEEDEEEDEKEEEEEEEGGDEGGPALNRPMKAKKKTLKQRRKEREQREEEMRRLQQKIDKKRMAELFRLKSIKKEIRVLETATREKEAELMEKERERTFQTQRLGKHIYQEPNIDVQLSSDVAGALRSLKPEGSIAADCFKSLQKRNIIEPRHVVKPFRRYKLKEVEKRSARVPEDKT